MRELTLEIIREDSCRVARDLRYNEKRRRRVRKNLNIGAVVRWVTRKPFYNTRTGIVVECIPKGKYPSKWNGLRIRGFYREDVSYVILADGKYFWPHSARLEECNAGVHSSTS